MNNRKIKIYRLLNSDNEYLLGGQVETFSEEGYELYGNPFGLLGNTGLRYFQAMVRYEDVA